MRLHTSQISLLALFLVCFSLIEPNWRNLVDGPASACFFFLSNHENLN